MARVVFPISALALKIQHVHGIMVVLYDFQLKQSGIVDLVKKTATNPNKMINKQNCVCNNRSYSKK